MFGDKLDADGDIYQAKGNSRMEIHKNSNAPELERERQAKLTKG